MKLTSILLLITSLAATAATEEQINKRFTVQPGGTVVVDVGFGSVDVTTSSANEVVVDVWRKIGRGGKSAEETYLRDNPVEFSQNGDKVTIRSRGKSLSTGSWSWFGGGRNQNQAKYTLNVPAKFNVELKTAGGGVSVSDLTGETRANTSGGGLRFMHLNGPLDGGTSGGSIHTADCQGTLKIHTSGGAINVSGGSGSIEGGTSGGSVEVKNFKGPARVHTSGGGIRLENVQGEIEGSTSGGSIHASLVSPLGESTRLSTSGGGITVRIPPDSAFDLDAETSGGGVSSDFAVNAPGKPGRSHLKGSVNGGGKSVFLRTSGGSISVKNL